MSDFQAQTSPVQAHPASFDAGKAKPFSAFEWMVALRYLRGSRGFVSLTAFLSFIAVFLGVFVLIVAMAAFNGFRKELFDTITGINGHIYLTPVDQPLTDFAGVSDRVRGVPGVKLVVPMVEGQAFASSPSSSSGVLVRGVREQDIVALPGIAANIKQGGLTGFDTSEGLVVGQKLAESLGVQIGDKIKLQTDKGAETAFGNAPRIKSYEVKAIFQIGMAEFDSILVYMPLVEAQLYFGKDDQATVIQTYVENPEDMDAVRLRIDQVVGRPMIASDWRTRNRSFFDALAVQRIVVFVVLSLIILVASFGIISGLTMLVKDKAHGVAILRTIGATRIAILRVFLITGLSIGISGTVLGTFFGLIVAKNLEAILQGLSKVFGANLFPSDLYLVSRLRPEIAAHDVFVIVALAFALSLAVTIYPAWMAAKLDPVEALRR